MISKAGSIVEAGAMGNGQLLVGKTGAAPQVVALSGDATINNTGALTLANSGVTAGTYKSVTVDTKGRVTAGTNPTTLAGYGITDAFNGTWASLTGKPTFATVATSGSYTDLLNQPSIPVAQVSSDWNSSSGVSQILNKPTTVAGYGITDAVTLTGNQTIAGTKTFSSDAVIHGLTVGLGGGQIHSIQPLVCMRLI